MAKGSAGAEGTRNGGVVVVGGGAAGMLAALRAARLGTRVSLLERNDRLGLKIHISGGGKCNITHAGDMEAVRRAFRPSEGAFLRPAFRRFTNDDVLAMVHAHGVETYVRPDGRVFPTSGHAEDVVGALASELDDAGVEVKLNERVTGLRATPEGTVVETTSRRLRAGRVVLAVGGSSYPKTGTTGDGYGWAAALGHTLVPLRAALAPIYLGDPRPEWSGVALRDVVLRARVIGREIARWRGDLLFTHKGLSGPCALGISREVAEAMEAAAVNVEAELLPDTRVEQLAAEFTSAQATRGGSLVRTLVGGWVPERLVDPLLESAGVPRETPVHRLPRSQRQALVTVLKGWRLGEVRAVPLERGEVTAGGVALSEVDPATMASRIVPGLFLAGEILDIAGPVGGYNLQAAFSTGWVAGEAAARAAGETRDK